MTVSRSLRALIVLTILALVTGAACARRRPTVPNSGPAPAPTLRVEPPSAVPALPPRPPQAISDADPLAAPPLTEDVVADRALDELNRNSPLQPAFFALDSTELDERGRQAVTANAEVLRKFPTWVITVEGHCDERGTAEYNLALGERRANAVRAYLVSLGIPQSRIRAVSYGKEFPFDPGHADAAWAQNRRAHFVITAR